ncbi:MAG: hypothetical protein H7X71_08515 [Chitinophagales bacterium]|nr:hypothetical protein [Chitinophagales bacterium]
MKNYLIIFLYSTFSFTLQAQTLIARHSDGAVNFYDALDEAVAASVDGDTLYLPGRVFAGTTIDKSLHIFGAGYNPDSTTATLRTQVSGSLTLDADASNGSVQGLYVTGDITLGSLLTNYSLTRCFVSGSFYLSGTNESVTIAQNIFSSLNGGNSESNFITNNVLYAGISDLSANNVIANNIFLNNSCLPLVDISSSQISNNIFTTANLCGGFGDVSSNIFENNIYVIAVDPCVSFYGGDNICNSNLSSIDETTLFETYDDGSPIAFYFAQDLRNLAGSPAINGGSDGTDIGIYGGLFPWKDGGLPLNPHIQSKSIGSTTDESGGLEINIKVAAQEE